MVFQNTSDMIHSQDGRFSRGYGCVSNQVRVEQLAIRILTFMIFFRINTVPGFRVLGFSALPGFRALKAGDGAWSVHKTLFGFKAPILSS